MRRAAVWSTLTMGALFGAFNLANVHLPLLPNPPSHNQTHAGFQLWAFAFLLTATTDRPRLVLWGTLVAQVLVGWGRVGDVLPFGVPAMLAGSLLQLAVACTTRSWGWIAAASLLAAGGVDALREGDALQANRWNQAVYAVALFGAVLPWIQGELLDGLRPGRAKLAVAAQLLAPLGAVLMAVSAMLKKDPGAGFLIVAASALLYALAVKPRAPALRMSMGGSHLFVAAALVAALSGTGLAFDAARHAFTIGFLTPALFGLAFPDRRLGSAAGLMLAGALLRQAQTVAALAGSASWLWVSAFSGLVAAAGVLLASTAVLRTKQFES